MVPTKPISSGPASRSTRKTRVWESACCAAKLDTERRALRPGGSKATVPGGPQVQRNLVAWGGMGCTGTLASLQSPHGHNHTEPRAQSDPAPAPHTPPGATQGPAPSQLRPPHSTSPRGSRGTWGDPGGGGAGEFGNRPQQLQQTWGCEACPRADPQMAVHAAAWGHSTTTPKASSPPTWL